MVSDLVPASGSMIGGRQSIEPAVHAFQRLMMQTNADQKEGAFLLLIGVFLRKTIRFYTKNRQPLIHDCGTYNKLIQVAP